MEIEEFFIVFAVLMLFFDLVQLFKAKPRAKGKLEYGFYATTLAFGLVVISYGMLVQAFLKDDFSLKEVYKSSSSSLPVASKLFATWSSAGGSLLFLTFIIAIAYFAYRFMTNEKRSRFSISTSRVLNFILIFFLILTLMKNPFERFPMAPLDGSGLNPQLQTFWMSIHPPIVFCAYVFVLFAFSLVLASMRTGEKAEGAMLAFSLRAAWLLLTLGISLGGLWAYEVLGWGGYWSWDPIETGSLITWVALTAYFHLGPLAKNRSLAKELMILLTFAAMIFLSALTRGGFRTSIHAYALSPAGPILLLFLLGMAIYFFYTKRRINKPFFSFEFEKSSLHSISLSIGYWSLISIFLVCLFGVVSPIVGSIFLPNPPIPSVGFYNIWNFPFVMGFVAALIGCSVHDKVSLKMFAALVAGALAAGVILIQLQVPTQNPLANLGLPLLTIGLFAVTYGLARNLLNIKRSVRRFGRNILHFGIIITLIGVFISSATSQVTAIQGARPNTSLEALGLEIELKNFTVYTGTGSVYSEVAEWTVPEYSALRMDVAIKQGRSIYNRTLWIRLFTLIGPVSTPLIITTWTGDIYIHMHHTTSMYDSLVQALMDNEVPPDDLNITVEMIPMVYLVWVGITLMSIGIAVPLIKGLTKPISGKRRVD
ncbi:MAG: cytochrome c biogenesis protein CcsA [Candidatus Bathyarchaeota archaeon]|nr:MAG: cytochrome c biogenesis protein CcsA [Candidatus Bathyarchaeota archaeon]